MMSKPDFKRWGKPEDYASFSEEEQKKWNENATIFVDIFWDLKQKGVLNIAFGEFALPEQKRSNEFFMKLLHHNNDVQSAVNMWINISSHGNSKKIVASDHELNDSGLAYTYLSLFSYSIVQNIELFRNVFLKLLNEDTIKTKKGELIEGLGDKGLRGVLEIMKKYSDKVEKMGTLLAEGNSMRNAFAHGLWRYEKGNLQWVDNVIDGNMSELSLNKFLPKLRKISHITQSFIWVTGELAREGLFKP